MPLSEYTETRQQALAEVCLGGVVNPVTGMEPRRQEIYRGLIFHVFREALERAYPLTRAALSPMPGEQVGRNRWEELLRGFVAEFKCPWPSLWRMPSGLQRYAVESRYGERIGAPWLSDLLLFEWVEIEVHMMPDRQAPACTPNGSRFRDRIVLNPDFKLIEFSYPVFKVRADELGGQEGRYGVLCFRGRAYGQVRFMELAPAAEQVLTKLSETPLRLRDLAGVDMSSAQLNELLSVLEREGMVEGYAKQQS